MNVLGDPREGNKEDYDDPGLSPLAEAGGISGRVGTCCSIGCVPQTQAPLVETGRWWLQALKDISVRSLEGH